MKKNTETKIQLPNSLSDNTINAINGIIESLPDSVIDKIDTISILLLSQNYELMTVSFNDIIKNGITLPNGKINPNYNVYNKMVTSIFQILKEFGLTAKARRYLPQLSAGTKENSPLDDFLKNNPEKWVTPESQVRLSRRKTDRSYKIKSTNV